MPTPARAQRSQRSWWPFAVVGALVLAVVATVIGRELIWRPTEVPVLWSDDQSERLAATVERTLLFTHSGGVHARDATTGAGRWRAGADRSRFPDPPNGLAYLLTDGEPVPAGQPNTGAFAARQQSVSAVDAATGQPRWRFDDFSGDFAAGTEISVILTHQGELIGLDSRSGALRWRTQVEPAQPAAPAGTPGRSRSRIHLSPRSRTVYLLGRADGVVALDEQTGRPRWTRPGVGGVSGAVLTPADQSDLVFLLDDRQLAALDPATGQQRWSWPARNGWLAEECVTVTGGTAYLLGRDALDALDAGTGQPRWSAPVPPASTKVSQGGREIFPCVRPLVRDGLVIAAPEQVVALDVATGSRRWRLDVAVSGPPVTARDGLYLPVHEDRTHHLLRVDPRTGDQVWRLSASVEFPDQQFSSTAAEVSTAGDGLVVYTCDQCVEATIYALRG